MPEINRTWAKWAFMAIVYSDNRFEVSTTVNNKHTSAASQASSSKVVATYREENVVADQSIIMNLIYYCNLQYI